MTTAIVKKSDYLFPAFAVGDHDEPSYVCGHRV